MDPCKTILERNLGNVGFYQALSAVIQALESHGFEILTGADFAEVLKRTLGLDIPRYVVISACHPVILRHVTNAEPWLGVHVTSNVVVRESADLDILVSYPGVPLLAKLVGTSAVLALVEQSDKRFRRLLENVTVPSVPTHRSFAARENASPLEGPKRDGVGLP